jgi:hypothetical protein
MITLRTSSIRKLIREALAEHISNMLVELDPEKHYILIVPDGPDGISADDLRAGFASFAGLNLVVLSASNVKLLEISRSQPDA